MCLQLVAKHLSGVQSLNAALHSCKQCLLSFVDRQDKTQRQQSPARFSRFVGRSFECAARSLLMLALPRQIKVSIYGMKIRDTVVQFSCFLWTPDSCFMGTKLSWRSQHLKSRKNLKRGLCLLNLSSECFLLTSDYYHHHYHHHHHNHHHHHHSCCCRCHIKLCEWGKKKSVF